MSAFDFDKDTVEGFQEKQKPLSPEEGLKKRAERDFENSPIQAISDPYEKQKVQQRLMATGDADTAMKYSGGNMMFALQSTYPNLDEADARKTIDLIRKKQQEPWRGVPYNAQMALESPGEFGELTKVQSAYNYLMTKDDRGNYKYPLTVAFMSNPIIARSMLSDIDVVADIEYFNANLYGSWATESMFSIRKGMKRLIKENAKFVGGVGETLSYWAEQDIKDIKDPDAIQEFFINSQKGMGDELQAFNQRIQTSQLLEEQKALEHAGTFSKVVGIAPQIGASALLYYLSGGSALIAGSPIAGMVGGQSYEYARSQNLAPDQSLGVAGISASTELLIEGFQIGSAAKFLGGNSVKNILRESGLAVGGVRFIGSMLGLMGEEAIAETGQSVKEEIVRVGVDSINRDIGYDEFKVRMGRSLGEGIEEGKLVAYWALLGGFGKASTMTKEINNSKTYTYLMNVLSGKVTEADYKKGTADAVDYLMKDGVLTHVYADVNALKNIFLQSESGEALDGTDKAYRDGQLEQTKKDLEITDEDFKEAEENDLKLKIKIGKWTEVVGNKPELQKGMASDITFQQDGFTDNEAVALEEVMNDLLSKSIQTTEALAGEQKLSPEEFKMLSKFKKELNRETILTKSDKRVMYEVYEAGVKAGASNLGITPKEFIEQNPLVITRTNQKTLVEMRRKSDEEIPFQTTERGEPDVSYRDNVIAGISERMGIPITVVEQSKNKDKNGLVQMGRYSPKNKDIEIVRRTSFADEIEAIGHELIHAILDQDMTVDERRNFLHGLDVGRSKRRLIDGVLDRWSYGVRFDAEFADFNGGALEEILGEFGGKSLLRDSEIMEAIAKEAPAGVVVKLKKAIDELLAVIYDHLKLVPKKQAVELTNIAKDLIASRRAMSLGKQDISFDNKASHFDLLFQGDKGTIVRGALQDLDVGAIMHLTENADVTTVNHELGHYFLEIMKKGAKDGKVGDQVIEDLNTLEAEYGNLDNEDSLEDVVKGWDTYLRSGKAPSKKLVVAFRRMRDWFVSLYKSLKASGVTPSKSVSEVYDRMLASEAEIAVVQDYYNESTLVDNYLNGNGYADRIARKRTKDAVDDSVDKLFIQSMATNKELTSKDLIKFANDKATALVDRKVFYKRIASLTAGGGIRRHSLEAFVGEDKAKEIEFKFPELVKEDGADLSIAVNLSGFKSVDSLLSGLDSNLSKSGAIQVEQDAVTEAIEDRMMQDAPLEDYHSEDRLKAMNAQMLAMYEKMNALEDKEILGEDYDMNSSHRAIMETGTDVQKIRHLDKLERELDAIEELAHEQIPISRRSISDLAKELKSTEVGLYLEIRRMHTDTRYDWRNAGGKVLLEPKQAKSYHSEKKGTKSYDTLSVERYNSIGMTLDDYADENNTTSTSILIDAYSSPIEVLEKELKDLAEGQLRDEQNYYENEERKSIQELITETMSGIDIDVRDISDDERKELLSMAKVAERKNRDRIFKKVNKEFYTVAKNKASDYLGSEVNVSKATKPFNYSKAEKALMGKAVIAMEKGNIPGAIDHIKNAMLNHALTTEAIRLQRINQKINKYFSTSNINKTLDKGQKVESSYKNSFLHVVNSYGLNSDKNLQKPDNPNAEETYDSLTPELEGDDSLHEFNYFTNNPIDPRIQKGEFINGQFMTMQDKIEIYETLQGLVKIGKGALREMAEQLSALGYKNIKTRSDLLDAVVNLLAGRPIPKKYLAGKDSWYGGLVSGTKYFFSQALQAKAIWNYVDGNPQMKKSGYGLTRGLNDLGANADANKIQRQRESEIAIANLLTPIREDVKKLNAEWGGNVPNDNALTSVYRSALEGSVLFGLEKVIPTTKAMQRGKDFQLWTADRLLSVLLNVGNKGGRDSLTNAHGMSMQQVHSIASLFSSETLDSINKILELEGSNFDEFDNVYYAQTNRHLPKVEAMTLRVKSSDGKSVLLKGGYHRLYYEKWSMNDKESKTISNEFKKMFIPPTKTTVKSKSTIARVENASKKYPVELKFNNVKRSIDDHIHHITHSQYLSEMDWLTRNRAFREAVEEKLGIGAYRAIRHSLDSQASAGYLSQEASISWVRKANKLRVMGSLRILGFKGTIGMKQRLSAFNAYSAMQKAGGNAGKYLVGSATALGTKTMTLGDTNNDTVERALAMSSLLRIRASIMDQNIHDSLNRLDAFPTTVNIKGNQIGWREVKQSAFWWIKANDMATVLWIWQGAYEQAIGENVSMNEEMDIEERSKIASRYADNIIRDTQPTALPVDLSEWQTSEIMKQFTSFMTFQMVFGNILMSDIQARMAGDIGNIDLMKSILMNVFLPQWSMLALRLLLFDGDDEPEPSDFLFDPAVSALSFIPGIRDVPASFDYGLRVFIPPAFSVPLSPTYHMIKKIKGDKPMNVEDWASYGGFLAGYLSGFNIDEAYRSNKNKIEKLSIFNDDKGE